MERKDTQTHKVDDIEKLPENVRAELIDGQLYYLTAPSMTHQEISGFLFNRIYNYIENNDGKCRVFAAPFAVYLDEENYLEPDISVICDRKKLDSKGCHGAPDWIIEIISQSTASIDDITKLNKYHEAGVKLYWIVNPMQKKVTVWYFERYYYVEYAFGEDIPVDIYRDFSIALPDRIGWAE